MQAGFAVARSLQLIEHRLQPCIRLITVARRGRLASCQCADRRAGIVRRQRVAFGVHSLLLMQTAREARVELLDAGALHHRLLRRLAGFTGKAFPALLPAMHRLLGCGERGQRRRFARALIDQARFEGRERRAVGRVFVGVARMHARRFRVAGLGLIQITALARAQRARVFDGLLATRGIRAELVVARLHAGEQFGSPAMVRPTFLDRRFRRAQAREGRLQRQFPVARVVQALLRLDIELAQP